MLSKNKTMFSKKDIKRINKENQFLLVVGSDSEDLKYRINCMEAEGFTMFDREFGENIDVDIPFSCMMVRKKN